jgi:transposase
LPRQAFLEGQLAAIDAEIARVIEENELTKAYHLLISVPGVQQISAAAILAETGADMQVFPTAGNLSSWAGVAPGNKISGGTAKRTSVSRGNRWLRTTLVECAWAASRLKDSPSKEQFAKLAAKGRKVALMAVAHSLAVIIHRTLATGQQWQPADRPMDEAKRERLVRHYIRRLGKLGVQVYSLRPEPIRHIRNPAGTVIDSRTKKAKNEPSPSSPPGAAEERNST